MIYEYACKDCGAQQDIYMSISEVKQIGESFPEYECPSCKGSLVKQISMPEIIQKVARLQPMNISTHAEEWKKKRAARVDQAIFEESIQSKTEMQDVMGVCQEEEKKRGKTPGTLTDGVKFDPNNKQAKETIKARDLKRKEESLRQRRKMF